MDALDAVIFDFDGVVVDSEPVHFEGFRAVPVRLRYEHSSYRTSVQGVEPGGELMRVLDTRLRPVELPPAGLVWTLPGLAGQQRPANH